MSDSVRPGERRDGDRAPIELKVEYKRLNTLFADYTRNISKGGTFIRTKRPLKIGTEFLFALTAPHLDEPVRILGRVQWITDEAVATDDRPAGMGIRFVYADDAERTAVETTIERLMSTELGRALSAKLLGRPPQAT